MHAKATLWLQRQLKKKQVALLYASRRTGVTKKELDDINEAIAVIEYLLSYFKEDNNGTARAKG